MENATIDHIAVEFGVPAIGKTKVAIGTTANMGHSITDLRQCFVLRGTDVETEALASKLANWINSMGPSDRADLYDHLHNGPPEGLSAEANENHGR